MAYNFYQNLNCEFFPCHKMDCQDKFSCQFCFCPLYYIKDCGGIYKDFNGMRDCEDCLIPHTDYYYVVNKIVETNRLIEDNGAPFMALENPEKNNEGQLEE